MTEDNHESHAGGAGGGDDFGQHFRAEHAGGQTRGGRQRTRGHRRRAITSPSTSATSREGQIPIHEFRERDGTIDVQEGDEIDVYFEASEGEDGGIVLSRQKAEQVKVWRDIEKAFEKKAPSRGRSSAR